MKTDNPSSNPIIKEAANPISHALIALKSVRDPFRTEISNIRQDIDNIINILDTSLYSLATGKENELPHTGGNRVFRPDKRSRERQQHGSCL